MHRDAILVDVSRVGIVDDAAFQVELALENSVFGARLDVYEPIGKITRFRTSC